MSFSDGAVALDVIELLVDVRGSVDRIGQAAVAREQDQPFGVLVELRGKQQQMSRRRGVRSREQEQNKNQEVSHPADWKEPLWTVVTKRVDHIAGYASVRRARHTARLPVFDVHKR